MRPYNSLPRGQDINNFPSLAIHQNKAQKKKSPSPINRSLSPRRRSPTRRSHSEEIYNDVKSDSDVKIVVEKVPQEKLDTSKPTEQNIDPITKRPIRINPLIKYASENRQCSCCKEVSCKEAETRKKSLKHFKTEGSTASTNNSPKVIEHKATVEKRVSFGNNDQGDGTKESPGKSKVRKKDILKQSHSLIEKTTRHPMITKVGIKMFISLTIIRQS